MKKLYKRIIAGVFVFVTLFFSCIPAVYAIDLPDDNNVWDLLGVNVIEFGDWLLSCRDRVDNWFTGIFDSDTCRRSSNSNGLHNFVERRTQVDGKTGLYYVCEYCGKSAGEVVQQAYSDYTASLPATGYNSAGRLVWQPRTYDLFDSSYIYYYEGTSNLLMVLFTDIPNFENVDILPEMNGYVYSCSNSSFNLNVFLYIKPIISGVYYRLDSFAYTYSYTTSSGGPYFGSRKYTTSAFHYSLSDDITYSIGGVGIPSGSSSSVLYGRYIFYFPTYEIIPDNSLGDTYSVTTRPTTITGGNYGIVGDNGQITTVTNNSAIINETNNIYYNPATGNTGTINSWTYNYTDRSYHVTLESGDTITVTYGDEYITIVEGDVIYNIYYIIEGSGSGNDCAHEWYQTGAVQGNCLTPAQRTYTCSLCGKQYTETDPVLGHSWRIIQTVSTKYDEDGELIQEGYTLYECERCGEQYKSTNDTGPPASGGEDKDPDVDDGGLIEFFNNLIRYLSNNLAGAVDLILSFFRKIPELFGGFLDFLSAMFPFLPDDIIFLLTFGIAAVVFVGFIKAIRR